ncbi:unnamed protein product, partial [Allacma fusca]
SYNKKESNA